MPKQQRPSHSNRRPLNNSFSIIPHTSHQGDLLIAHPGNPSNELNRSVILITHHNPSSGEAVGIQINNPINNFTVLQLAHTVGLAFEQDQILLDAIPLHYGGNRYPHRAQVIHTHDWLSTSSRVLNDHLALTSDIGILTALLSGEGPKHYRVCLGCWIWDNLDRELANKNRYHWEVLPATSALLFNSDSNQQWSQCLNHSIKHNVKQWISQVLPSTGAHY